MRPLLFLILFLPALALGAGDEKKKLTPLKLRLEMHRRLMEKFLHGRGPDEGLFDDLEEMLEQNFSGSLQGLNHPGFGGGAAVPVKTSWKESEAGRTLRIEPLEKDLKLDIKVEAREISIKGEKEARGGGKVAFSEFSYSLSTPADVDTARVKISQEKGVIVVFFPFQKT